MNQKFKEARRAKRLPILGLSVMAKVSTTTIVACEKWGYKPVAEIRERLARVLGVDEGTLWPVQSDEEDHNE